MPKPLTENTVEIPVTTSLLDKDQMVLNSKNTVMMMGETIPDLAAQDSG